MSALQLLSSRQRTIVVLGIGLFACLLLLFLLEAAVRIRAHAKYGYTGGIEKTFTVDSQSGLRVPIANGRFGSVQINSLGFRSPELKQPKEHDTVRVAFLGGSTTYCAEVSSPDLTWPHLLTTSLAEKFPHSKFDYVNGGVPGYGAKSSLRNLNSRIKPLDPDVIVIYHATNDLSFNSYQLAVDRGIADRRTEQDLSWISKYSLLAYLVEKNLAILANKRSAESQTGKLVFEPEVLVAPFTSDLMELTEASLQVADLVVLVTFTHHLRRGQTHAQAVRAAETSLYYMPYMTISGLREAFEAYNISIRDVAQETDSLLIDIENRVPGDPEHFFDSVHLTDVGNRAMAAAVFEVLADSTEFQSLIRSNLADAGSLSGQTAN